MATAHPGTSILEIGGFLTPILPSGMTLVQLPIRTTIERTIDQRSVITRTLNFPGTVKRILNWRSLISRTLKPK